MMEDSCRNVGLFVLSAGLKFARSFQLVLVFLCYMLCCSHWVLVVCWKCDVSAPNPNAKYVVSHILISFRSLVRRLRM